MQPSRGDSDVNEFMSYFATTTAFPGVHVLVLVPVPAPPLVKFHCTFPCRTKGRRVKAISSGAPFRPPTRCCLSILHSPWCTFSIPLSLFIAVSVSLATFSGTRRDDAPICYLPLLLQQFQGRIGSRQRRTTKKGANKTTAQEESQERGSRNRTRT